LPANDSKHAGKKIVEMRCTRCGGPLRRMLRKGFLQEKIYSLFGYYPWECPYCREPIMIKMRNQGKKLRAHPSSAD
jgi:DNA-directed RNA polymerase subunit RPC12/RpoP